MVQFAGRVENKPAGVFLSNMEADYWLVIGILKWSKQGYHTPRNSPDIDLHTANIGTVRPEGGDLLVVHASHGYTEPAQLRQRSEQGVHEHRLDPLLFRSIQYNDSVQLDVTQRARFEQFRKGLQCSVHVVQMHDPVADLEGVERAVEGKGI